MDAEKIEPQPSAPGRSWRRFWKRACIGSACFAVMLLMISGVLAPVRNSPPPSNLVLVIDGLIALFQLIWMTLACISAIGWVICRSRDGAFSQPENSPSSHL